MARILIIEDNPANMKLACLLLRNAGHTVLSADDAEEGLTLARAALPDLILMDIQLPGMNGLEATRHIKSEERLAHIPVIAVTSFALAGDDAKARAAGCDNYVSKPFSPRAVLAMVRGYLA